MKINFSFNEIDKIIKEQFLPRINKCKIFTFKGPLGAGKTTIIKEILKTCGVEKIVTSPTFNYVNSYKTKSGKTFHHFDLYRLDSLDSFLSLGLDEYFYEENSICFVEWPKIIETLLNDVNIKKYVCKIVLSFDESGSKKRLLKID
ncbi:tRNA (adenosine(37)-N6)-threonylcarbamoyltransferase complex ATPase subunit type 1 TsaE [Candidatus Dependentiae bacterium]|nr:tRNA (adenosine(37)-N6)-threonylcarbamoyltransferase complex ATPase subunit type 1 TsaE [Candidatus Dependentiae bacterium]